MGAFKDLTGHRFGRLAVLARDPNSRNGHIYWRCLCDCGNETAVRSGNLISGRTTSCGCHQRETIREIMTTHNMSNNSLYSVWRSMKSRCNSPNNAGYKNYGGRGIFICDEWDDFENFRDWALNNGYKEGLSIDRIDNDDGYYPGNCRWADAITQQNNKRNNRHVTYDRETHTISEWARLFNISHSILRHRMDRGDMRDFEEYFKRDT